MKELYLSCTIDCTTHTGNITLRYKSAKSFEKAKACKSCNNDNKFLISRTGTVKFGITSLDDDLKEEGYFKTVEKSEALDTAKLAKDVRERLIGNGVPITSFFLDGMLCSLLLQAPESSFGINRKNLPICK